MVWQKRLLTEFKSLKLELEPAPVKSLEGMLEAITGGQTKVLVVVPVMPDRKTVAAIKKIVPMEVEFVERIKTSTVGSMKMLLQSSGYSVDDESVNRDCKLKLSTVIERTELTNVIGELSNLIFKDGYYDTWTFVVDGKQEFKYNRAVINAVASHKIIEAEINPLDLRIMLESTNSVDEFLKLI
jgi:hypothetical protein